MKTNIKDIEFGPEHVGQKVTSIVNGRGEIISFIKSYKAYPVEVSFKNGVEDAYTTTGRACEDSKLRDLFVGHNVKINVEEEELPEKLICPVCGIVHEPYDIGKGAGYCCNNMVYNCPYYGATFREEEDLIIAMKNLIKSMA